LQSIIERKLANLTVPLQLVMPSGQILGPNDCELRFVVKDPSALAHMATGQVGGLGRDYVEGKVDFQGSMRALMRAVAGLLPESPVKAPRGGWLFDMLHRMMSAWRHTEARDARQIEFHYDFSDEFFQLWLDPRRAYSCAYYRRSDMTLAQAQEAKFEHICCKLDLRPGERFLDVGAGWGGLLLWAAEHYGVNATGITLSRNQCEHVNALIKEKGLSDRVRMALQDYRKLDPSQPFDKISSVGMFEHVGRAKLPEYFNQLANLLKPGGLIMNHGITAVGLRHHGLGSGMGDFIEKYIFPGGELTHICNVLEAATQGGLETLDVENLRPHYARTLWTWSDNLETHLNEARDILVHQKGEEAGMQALRAYRIYLAGCAMAFEHGWIALHQVVAQRAAPGGPDELDLPLNVAYPWRRDYMYSPRELASP
jgi:cyclopropane-fatty-acyl-phospholipid synthase